MGDEIEELKKKMRDLALDLLKLEKKIAISEQKGTFLPHCPFPINKLLDLIYFLIVADTSTLLT